MLIMIIKITIMILPSLKKREKKKKKRRKKRRKEEEESGSQMRPCRSNNSLFGE